MSHIKRENTPLTWPIPRKGTAFIVKTDPNGLPVLVALRDILKVVKTRNELKKAIHKKEVLLCNKEIRDEKKTIKLLDVLTIVPSKKNYIMTFSNNGKFEFKEITEKDKDKKIAKIIDKRILKGKKVQLNLGDGRNFLSELKCLVNDSVVINLKTNKIGKCLPLKEGSNVLVIGGKHTGEEGQIKKIDKKMGMVEVNNKEKILKILIKQIMVVE